MEKSKLTYINMIKKNDKCHKNKYKFISYDHQSSNISLKRHNLSQ